MACSGAGLVAIIILAIAVVLNVLSFILPVWSTSDVVNETLVTSVTKADFAAGVWGYCTDVELTQSADKNTSIAFDHCYFFHTSNKIDLGDLNDQLASNYEGYSVCDGYGKAQALGEVGRKAYTGALALVAGMDAGSFDVFIHRSCTALGSATIVFASFASSTGLLAFIGLVLGVTCCKNKSSFNAAVKVLISIALVSTVLTFVLWLFQSHPLNKKDDVSLNGSFVLNVLSGVLFLISGALLARHNAMQ